MSQDEKYRLKYIVPFMYSSDKPGVGAYGLINKTLCNSRRWEPSSVDLPQENEIYDFVCRSLDGALEYNTPGRYKSENSSCICSVWKNTTAGKKRCRFINRKNNHNHILDFELSNVVLYLFWNHIGMFCYEAGFSTAPSLEMVCEFQNSIIEFYKSKRKEYILEELSENVYENDLLKEEGQFPEESRPNGRKKRKEIEQYVKLINQFGEEKYIRPEDLTYGGQYFSIVDKSKPYHVTETAEDSTSTRLTIYKPLRMRSWVEASLLSEIRRRDSICIEFFYSSNPFKLEESKGRFAGKAIPFVYASLDQSVLKDQDTAYSTTYRLANGYGHSHNTSTDSSEFWEHTDGVLWYASRQGCCCTVKKGNPYSRYFESKIDSRFSDDYFVLFLLRLNQMFGLAYYDKEITEELTSDISEYTKDNPFLQKKLQRIHAEINLFLMKNLSTSISNIQKQNEFFTYIKNQFNTDQEIASIKSGLEGLDSLQDLLTQRKEENKQNAAEKKLSFSLGLLSLLAAISAVIDLINLFFGNGTITFKNIIFNIIMLAVIFIVGYAVINLYRYKNSSGNNTTIEE